MFKYAPLLLLAACATPTLEGQTFQTIVERHGPPESCQETGDRKTCRFMVDSKMCVDTFVNATFQDEVLVSKNEQKLRKPCTLPRST